MKKLILAAALLACTTIAGAVTRPVNVADSTISTVSGVGGYTEVAYTFAKGDKITFVANASKHLERAMVIMAPTSVLIRVKDTKKVKETFEVPADGIVYFRFVSDRGGVNNIRYSIMRLPASEAVQDLDTKAEVKGNTSSLRR